jgi:hypothetical protein
VRPHRRPPLVKRQTTPSERFLAFFPRSRAWRSRPSVSSADVLSLSRGTPPWLHHTRIEALSPWQWRVPRDVAWSLGGLAISPYPHTGLRKGVAERVPFASECQARERGSTREPWTTLTVEKGRRRIPAGMLGRGPHTLSRHWSRPPTASASPTLPAAAHRQRSAGVPGCRVVPPGIPFSLVVNSLCPPCR